MFQKDKDHNLSNWQKKTSQHCTILLAKQEQQRRKTCPQDTTSKSAAPAAADTTQQRKTCMTKRRWQNKSLQSSCRLAKASLAHCSAHQQGKEGTGPAPAAADTIQQRKTCMTKRRWRNKSLQSSCRSANAILRNYNANLKDIACKLPARFQQNFLHCIDQKD